MILPPIGLFLYNADTLTWTVGASVKSTETKTGLPATTEESGTGKDGVVCVNAGGTAQKKITFNGMINHEFST